MEICDVSKCTGCFSCLNGCPKDAIRVGVGFLDKSVPVIDESKCVNCGLCVKNCPVNNPVALHNAECSVAAWSPDEEDIALSSSGGISAIFSDVILENGGVVFGSALENGKTGIIPLRSKDEINRIRGSKYVQSFPGYSYREAKAELDAGKQVLFFGTPCQIAGLLRYLRKAYDNLITVDLICHGVPPERYLTDHLSFVLKDRPFDRISFRKGTAYSLSVFCEENAIYSEGPKKDTYLCSFVNSLTLRDNCFVCPYSAPERCSDITIGDFWGIDRSKLVHPYKGKISVVLPNTEKGLAFFTQCSDRLIWEKRSLSEACNPKQTNLIHPSVPHSDRAAFEKYYPKCGFEKAVRSHTRLGKEIVKEEKRERLQGTVFYRGIRKVFAPFRGAFHTLKNEGIKSFFKKVLLKLFPSRR